ncbi:hypothetical protein QLQ09_01170 [Brucella sp. NM4]|uniref:hypothetical protein n=1 Tax=Brucella/Ochrobactrum group TaxID=2826938 RepID=UPI0024BD42FE|nr:hypothetical protein [Brucella sp. NM4]WHS30227.1 hypothetical protein QLQ09_01170 [Brucella sp. NM4]WHT44289.1 hypothetical protein QLQ11_20880 [Ochrobactrum sp. SSR]
MKSLFMTALVSVGVFTSSSAYALDARKDCSTLKQVIKQSKVNFKNVAADVPPKDVDVYPSKLTLTGSNFCRVVLRTNVSSVSWSCVLEDSTVKAVAEFVSNCVGRIETPDQAYQRVGAKIFRLKPQVSVEIIVSELDRGSIALQVKALQNK